MSKPRLVAYTDDHGTLRTYQTVYNDDDERTARYDCAIDKRIPLDRVVVVIDTPVSTGPVKRTA
jgi:hypothetical protein